MGGYDLAKKTWCSIFPFVNPEGFGAKLGAGMTSGMIGAAIANPADLVSALCSLMKSGKPGSDSLISAMIAQSSVAVTRSYRDTTAPHTASIPGRGDQRVLSSNLSYDGPGRYPHRFAARMLRSIEIYVSFPVSLLFQLKPD